MGFNKLSRTSSVEQRWALGWFSMLLLFTASALISYCSEQVNVVMPEQNRFTKEILDFNLDEPMEMDELGNRGIIFIERRGSVKLYEYETAETIALDTIRVQYANEDGLLGIAVDPSFRDNQWIYFFYSSDIEESKQYVSRFTLTQDELTDEKVLLKIPLIRQCCHSGGSLEFDDNGLLYIGVGDNTNPFESSGYAPIDERPNRELYDAQRSASNTNDLRGKILRIKPEDDGSYSIPEGNLFPQGTNNTRPEIYVMGCRNPFRFSIDTATDYLYWGDVGPDAGVRDSLRGPEGMGELNQATTAGYYGWPYSRGNNQMYVDYDFHNKQSGLPFNPDQIVNNSPNNTGLTELPPIKESMIWYSYKKSEEFPWLGSGGVNPMSGPIYHAENYTGENVSLPLYYDNKWFVYEWMRDWVYIVDLDKNHNYLKAEPFMPHVEFSHPMDMLLASDGRMYVLEYGQKWNSRNLDARLSVIHYNDGNRPPVAIIESDVELGATPLTVHFSADESVDYDNDDLQYVWQVDDQEITTKEPSLSYTFNNPGVYDIQLTVDDGKGESHTTTKKILAGNEPPQIKISLSDENRTYRKNKELTYNIEVMDQEDGSTGGAIDPESVKVTFNYIPEGEDLILAAIGHQQNTVPQGLELINASDCKACHAVDQKVAGPSYEEIAQRYTSSDKQTIIHRIIKGSQGVWGEQMMSAHPQLSLDEVSIIVDYILSLDPNKQVDQQLLPLTGKVGFNEHLDDAVTGKYVLMASYLDKGHPDVPESALSTSEQIVFIAPRIEIEDAIDLDKDMGVWDSQNRTLVGSIRHGKHLRYAPISFSDLKSITIGAAFNGGYPYYGIVEVRKGSPEGRMVGSGEIEYYHEEKSGFSTFEIDISDDSGVADLFLVFNNSKDEDQFVMNGDWIQLNYE